MNHFHALIIFNVFVVTVLAVDLGLLHRRAHTLSLKEAATWSAFWVFLSLVMNAVVYFWRGPHSAIEFLTGYILEGSLSLDNVFVFVVIFRTLGIPERHQHKVLFWGVLGAILMRALFVVGGIALLSRYHWVQYVFGAFLIIVGAKLLPEGAMVVSPERGRVLRLARKVFPIIEQYAGSAFFTRSHGKLVATRLLIVLLLVESADLIFALDSVPAVLAVTHDPFIAYTSNALAVLGMRAVYFVLSGVMERFRYLHIGLSLVLVFVGAKMLLARFYKFPPIVSLLIICGVLGVAILTSLRREANALMH
jgi:TerC family integral membrane protein